MPKTPSVTRSRTAAAMTRRRRDDQPTTSTAPVLQEEEDEAEDGEDEDELPTRRTSHKKPSPAKDVGRSDTLFSSVKKK